MTIIELRNKRAKALEAAKAFLEAHRNTDGFLSEEDDAIYTGMENDITSLGREISRMERLEAMDSELSRPVNAPITEKPARTREMDEKTGRASDNYKKAFWNQLRRKNEMTPELRNALETGTDSEGGYPQVIKEAMACGLPIVSVDVGDVRERIGGLPGCYVAERHDAAQLTALLRLALAFSGRTKGRQRLIELGLDNQQVVQQLIQIYEKTI